MASPLTGDGRLEDLTLDQPGDIWTDLSGSEIGDAIIVALALLVAGLAARRALLTLLTGARPGVKDYHAVALLVTIEEYYRGKVWSRSHLDRAVAARYPERGLVKRAVAVAAVIALFVFDILWIFMALPANADIVRRPQDILGVTIKTPERPTRRTLTSFPCQTGQAIKGNNLANQVTWTYCVSRVLAPSSVSRVNRDDVLVVALEGQDGNQTRARALYVSGNISATTVWEWKVRLAPGLEAFVNLNGGMPELKEALDFNLRATSQFFGLRITATDVRQNQYVALVDSTQARLPGSLDASGGVIGIFWLNEAITPVFDITVGGSQLLFANLQGRLSPFTSPVVVGRYTGPLVRTLGALIMAGVFVAVNLILCLARRRGASLLWEVAEAHGRLCADHLLAGPNEKLELAKSRSPAGVAHVGYGLRDGYATVKEFVAGEEVSARSRPKNGSSQKPEADPH